MTFTEAAALVLRLVGKPLHYKEITDVAIEKNLLSHVGKSPEVTMGARLAALVKKNEKDNPLLRIKPGVFALREWDQATIDQGLRDRTPALERLARNPELALEPEPEDEPDGEAEAEGDAAAPDETELERVRIATQGSELFAAEEDDDDPIFGGPEPEADDDDERAAAAGDVGRRRRRRRRRGRNGDEPAVVREGGGDDLPGYTVSDAPASAEGGEAAAEARPPARRGREPREGGGREPREGAAAREPREGGGREPREGGGREPREGGGREPREGAPREGREPRGEGRDREPRGDREGRDREPRGDREGRDREGRDREPRRELEGAVDDLAGVALAEAAAILLGSLDRSGGPVPFGRLVEAAQRRGKLTGDVAQAQSALSAAVRADNLRRAGAGQRARFRVFGGRVALSDWSLDADLLRLEREALAAAERYRDAFRRQLVRRVQELAPRVAGEFLLLVLERLGVSDTALVRRAGSSPGEVHLSARQRTPLGEQRIAILFRRDGREVGRERVSELRGSLHHYDAATAAIVVTTGQVLSGAREEAAAPGAAPVALIDGLGLARLCEEHGVGVLPSRVSLGALDLELFEALRGGG